MHSLTFTKNKHRKNKVCTPCKWGTYMRSPPSSYSQDTQINTLKDMHDRRLQF